MKKVFNKYMNINFFKYNGGNGNDNPSFFPENGVKQ